MAGRRSLGVAERIGEAVVEASTKFRPDMLRAYARAAEAERNPTALWVEETLVANAKCSAERCFALCDDTGTPHVYVEVGDGCVLPAGFLEEVREGLRKGMDALPTRPMAVRGDEVERVGQLKGLATEPGELVPGSFLLAQCPGEAVQVTVLMLGGGPELRARTYRIFHQRSLAVVLDEVAEWANEMMPLLGCTPATLAVGIGRTHFEASSLVLKAMREGSLDCQSEWEQRLTRKVNEIGVGALGVGGNTTVLGSFLRIGPQRASGFRIVSLRPCCCMEPRRATVSFSFP
jgi:fumarate hydratase subunit alpha